MTENSVTDSPAEAPAAPPPGKRRSYLLRHWRGELSLPVAYWVNGILGDIPVVLLAAAAAFATTVPALLKPAMVGGVAVWAVAILVSVWQLVGVWRSAGRHVARGGRRLWAVLARVSVGVGIVTILAQIVFSAVPQTAELVRILSGDAEYADHKLELLPGGREILYSGAITFGVTDELRRLIDASPAVWVIHLDSRGGRLVEARNLRDLIASRGLSTYVSEFCVSACTTAFMGGRARYLAPGAKLGFHRLSIPGTASFLVALEIAKEKAALIRAGVTPVFAERAFKTPASSMWYPTQEELTSAGVVTALATLGQFAPDHGLAAEIDGELQKIAAFAILEQDDPAAYAAIRDKVARSVGLGEDRATILRQVRTAITPVLKEYLPRASGDAAAAMAQVVVEEIEQIDAKDPEACFHFVAPKRGGGPVDIDQYLSDDLKARDLAALAQVIKTGAETPQMEPTREEVQPLMRELASRLRAKYGDDVNLLAEVVALSKNAPTPDYDKTCRMVAAAYREVLAFDVMRRDPMLRFMFSH